MSGEKKEEEEEEENGDARSDGQVGERPRNSVLNGYEG